MNIEIIIQDLIKKYKTNNPFEICDQKNILVLKEPLGTINGYYNKFYRQKIIHINSELEHRQSLFTCSHELGHALLHPNSNTPFLRANTFLLVDKLELEANKFATLLLISDEDIKDFITYEYTTQDIARNYGISEELIKLILKYFKN